MVLTEGSKNAITCPLSALCQTHAMYEGLNDNCIYICISLPNFKASDIIKNTLSRLESINQYSRVRKKHMSCIVIIPFMRFHNHVGYQFPFDSSNQSFKVSDCFLLT